MKYKLMTLLTLFTVAMSLTISASSVSSLTSEQEKLKEQIDDVNKKIMNYEDQINDINSQIGKNEQQIEKLEKQQKKTREKLEISKEGLGNTLIVMQRLNNTNTLTTYFYDESEENNNYFLKLENVNVVMDAVTKDFRQFTSDIEELDAEITEIDKLQTTNKKKKKELKTKRDEQAKVEDGLKEELASVEDEIADAKVQSASGNVSAQKQQIMAAAGISPSDYVYVDYIITKESGWNSTAANPISSAYGLCQSLPGSKMASAGSDWQTNAVTQLKWCDGYANSRYGSWAAAYSFWISHNWW